VSDGLREVIIVYINISDIALLDGGLREEAALGGKHTARS